MKSKTILWKNSRIRTITEDNEQWVCVNDVFEAATYHQTPVKIYGLFKKQKDLFAKKAYENKGPHLWYANNYGFQQVYHSLLDNHLSNIAQKILPVVNALDKTNSPVDDSPMFKILLHVKSGKNIRIINTIGTWWFVLNDLKNTVFADNPEPYEDAIKELQGSSQIIRSFDFGKDNTKQMISLYGLAEIAKELKATRFADLASDLVGLIVELKRTFTSEPTKTDDAEKKDSHIPTETSTNDKSNDSDISENDESKGPLHLIAKVQNNRPLVSARDLYKALQVKTWFNDWVKQNFKDFEEEYDYTSQVVTVEVPNNGGKQLRQLQDYFLTLDMAKELCMLSRTEKGKQVRRYFIQVEKKYRQQQALPQTPEEKLALTMQVANRLVPRVDRIEKDVAELKNKSEIDSTQRYQLGKARNETVVKACGGKKSNFYKEKNAHKVYMQLFFDFKEKFEVPRYESITKEQFDKALKFIKNWYPPFNLKQEIDQINAQTNLDI